MMTFSLATRPYSVIDAVNRMAAATGSMRYATGAAHADYNGHAVSVTFNDYKGYWIAEYTWSGRNVLARGTLKEALSAAKREYDRGALGASVRASYPVGLNRAGDFLTMDALRPKAPSETEEDFAKLCEEAGYTLDTAEDFRQEAARAAWWTPLHDKVNDAMSYERHGLAPAVSFLVQSTTVEEYEAKLEAFFAERRLQRA